MYSVRIIDKYEYIEYIFAFMYLYIHIYICIYVNSDTIYNVDTLPCYSLHARWSSTAPCALSAPVCVLQSVTVCCNVFQCVLQCAVVYFSVLQCVAACTTLGCRYFPNTTVRPASTGLFVGAV